MTTRSEGVIRLRAEFVAYLRRTEGRLAFLTVAVVVSAIAVGVLGALTVRDRQSLLDEAVDRRGAVTKAALDVYRALADADATALDAVLADAQRAPGLQQSYRENVFDALDALREASARDREGTERIRELTDLLPEYSRLVEIGWANSRSNQPVGTSYLSNASHLVRGDMLTAADGLHTQQRKDLKTAQQDASRPPWAIFLVGLLGLAVLVAAQRSVRRRTRRRFNIGLAAATALTMIALVWLGSALAIAGNHADDSIRERDGLVAPLAQARNIGRLADGDEARILIFPKAGDINRLRTKLDEIGTLLDKAKNNATADEATKIDRAADSLRLWRDSDKKLLERPNPPPTYQEVAALITGTPTGQTLSYAEQLDGHLTDAIDTHTRQSEASTVSARSALANLDAIFFGLLACAAVAAVSGMWPRIAEYYR